MYPSYGRLWHPVHGIRFSHARSEETQVHRADVLCSLHTTVPDRFQNATATSIERSDHSDDDRAACSTAPEFPPKPGIKAVSDALLAAADGTRKRGGIETATLESSGPVEPPATDLDFQVSLEAFREAQSARVGTPESFWSYTIYRGPAKDGIQPKVTVHYCRSKRTMERVCQYFLEDDVLGFDIEWHRDAKKNSGPRKNVSLIQLANQSRIALFHISLFPEKDELVSPTFRKIMENPDVRKVGVAIKADCTRLRNNLAIDTKGIFELSHLYKLVKYSENGRVNLINKRLVTLANQVEEHLGLPMFKGQDVRSSDWSLPLSMAQIMYSASDAYAGFQLYHVLDRKRECLDPTPPRPFHAELNLPIRLADGVSILTVDETTEDADVEETTAPSTLQFEAVRESIQIEHEGDGESASNTIKAAPSTTPKKNLERDPRVIAADVELANYRASIKSLCASPTAVRSYFIWRNNEDLNPEGIARILREPPLQTMTVVGYILKSIKQERLPFDKARLKRDVLSLLLPEARNRRYKALVREASKPDAE